MAPEPLRQLNVIALAPHPIDAASSRYRIVQFIEPLKAQGIRLQFIPFLSSGAFGTLYDRDRIVRTAFSVTAATVTSLLRIGKLLKADALLIQREAMLIGPPVVESLAARAGRAVILDLDDATWMDKPHSVYGRAAKMLRWPGKTDQLIRLASSVICGNEAIAEYVQHSGRRARIAPTIVDTAVFAPSQSHRGDQVPVIGWIGTHSTYAYFETLIPALERLARDFRFRLRVVGSGRDAVDVRGVEVDTRRWALDREVEDFATLDIGLYPLPAGTWEEAKSGFKAVQYLSAGVPFVASPVGVAGTMGIAGKTHLLAESPDEWYDALSKLIEGAARRRAMGEAARQYAVEHFSIARHAALIASEIRLAVDTVRGGTRAKERAG